GNGVRVDYVNPTLGGGTLKGCVPASGSTFALGTTSVTCTATNLCTTNSCSFNVLVQALASSIITLNCPVAITTNICGNGVRVDYVNPTLVGGTFRDCVPASGSTFVLGTTSVTCTATNLCTTNSCSFNVLVQALA